jgi:hypothetical protein
MENLTYYLFLLACPLMLVVLLFFMKGMFEGKNNNESEGLQKNVNQLIEQNQQLIKEIEAMKRDR